jgi:hypothetical protein
MVTLTIRAAEALRYCRVSAFTWSGFAYPTAYAL